MAVQTALMPHAALGTVKPMVPLLAVVAWGILRGRKAGLWWAIALGLLLDVMTPTAQGLYTLPLMAGAAITAFGDRRLAPTNILLPGAIAAAATVVYTLTQRGLLASVLAGSGGPTIAWNWPALGEDLLPVVALNMLWMPVVYFPLRYVARRAGEPRMEWGR